MQKIRDGYKRLGDYIEPVDERNSKLSVKLSQGICNNKYFITPRQVAENSANDKIVRTGQFAYNRATTRNGDKISIAYREGPDCTVSSAYQVFRIKDENQLNPYYLWMWFRRPEFDRYARFKSRGSAHEFFEWDEMCEVYLPIPDIDTQRRIVAEYQTVEARIAANDKMIAKLEETAQTLYKKMFVDDIDPENLPDGWRLTTLESLSDCIIAGTIPNYSDEGSEFVLGQKCIYDHKVRLDKARRHIPKASCKYVKYGDLLINSTGDGTLGRVGQVFFEPKLLAFDSNMTLVRPANKNLIDYLYLFLQSKEEFFVSISQGSTNQTRLYCSMVKPVDVILPPEDLLIVFSRRMDPINALSRQLEEEQPLLRQMLSLFQSRVSNQQ